jgi:integrase
MPSKKGEKIEAGIWRKASGKGYIVEVNLGDAITGERVRKRKFTRLLELARQWRDTQKADSLRGEIRKERASTLTFKEFVPEYLSTWGSRRKPSTVAREKTRIANILEPYFGNKRLSAVTQRDIELFIAGRLEGKLGPVPGRCVSTSTSNRDLCRLKNLFKKAVELGHIEKNPAGNVRQEREPITEAPFLTVEQIHRLLGVCSPTLRPILLVAIHTGLRWGEIRRLEWRDVDFENRVLTVRDTKNADTRFVPMGEDVIKCLEEHRSTQTRKQGRLSRAVFMNRRLRKPYADVRKPYKKALKAAGIDKGFRFHDLRHTAGSQMVMAGVDLRTVQKILGHRTPLMTMRYAHLSDAHMAEAANKLQDRLNKKPDSAMDTLWTPPEIGTELQGGVQS